MIETQRAFAALCEEYVEVSLRQDPVAATRAGVHDYDHLLPDHSPDGVRTRSAWLRGMDERLVASVPWEELPVGQRAEFAYLRSLLATERVTLDELRRDASNPSLPPFVALDSVFQLATRRFAPLEERKEALLERLMGIPDYLEGARLSLQQPTAVGLAAAHDLGMNGPAYLDGVVRDLLRAFPGEAERIEHAGERARVGLFQYQEFVDNDLRARGESSAAIGERWLNHLIERQHLLSMDAAYIETHARQLAKDLESELEAEARALDPARSWREQIADSRHQHPEPLRLREAYEAELARALRFVRERMPFTIPQGVLEIIDTPEYLRASIPFGAYASPAPLDADVVGSLLVTPVNLGMPDDARDQTLAGHDEVTLSLRVARELWPGRHLQSCSAVAAGSRLKRLAESVLTNDGWAIDAERQMLEAGFFLDPRARLCVLRERLEAALLAVVDTGLHARDLPPAAAEDLLMRRALTLAPGAAAGVRRALLEPGSALCAFIGSELVGELRDEWKSRMRAAFDPVRFHAEFFRAGCVPLFLVREQLQERVATP